MRRRARVAPMDMGLLVNSVRPPGFRGQRTPTTAIGSRLEDGGSATVLVLMVLLGVTALVTALYSLSLAALSAAENERIGHHVRAGDQGQMGVVLREALSSWQYMVAAPAPGYRGSFTPDGDNPENLGTVKVGRVTAPGVLTTTVGAERGRDGLDLPRAALVARRLRWHPDRTDPLLLPAAGGISGGAGGTGSYGDADQAAVTVALLWGGVTPELLPAGTKMTALTSSWHLDEGSALRVAGVASASDPEAAVSWEVAPPDNVLLLSAGGRVTPTLLSGRGGGTETPVLIVSRGAAAVDLGGLGPLHGVVVADGDVVLEGTEVYGAVFATGDVDLGATGRLIYHPAVFRWATDRSLMRGRLVPGTVEEALVPE